MKDTSILQISSIYYPELQILPDRWAWNICEWPVSRPGRFTWGEETPVPIE